MKEIWKDVLGFEGFYKVSNTGRVVSLPREWDHWRGGKSRRGKRELSRILRGGKDNRLVSVRLCADGTNRLRLVKQLVVEAFTGKPLAPRHRINTKDGDENNLHLSNLEW